MVPPAVAALTNAESMLSISAMSGALVPHTGLPVHWAELSYPFCEPGAPCKLSTMRTPWACTQPRARRRYGHAPGIYGVTEVLVSVGMDQKPMGTLHDGGQWAQWAGGRGRGHTGHG